MGDIIMKIGATKPVMKDTMPILKRVLTGCAGRWIMGVYMEPIQDDMYKKKRIVQKCNAFA
jgi:hypothetical protein